MQIHPMSIFFIIW